MLIERLKMISVIIPVYNRGAYLKKALDSVISQKDVELEIIVIDDNSTEDLHSIVDGYDCIYHKNHINKGAQYSRNLGVYLSTNPYIAFLDSDDIWHCPNKLKFQLQSIKNFENASLVYTPLRLIDEDDKIIEEACISGNVDEMHNSLYKMLNKDFIGTYSSVLIDKKKFHSSGGCDEKLPARQDWDLWIRLASNGSIIKDSRTAISYRMHLHQISASGEKKLLGYISVMENNLKLYNKNLITKYAYYKNLLKMSLLVGFVGKYKSNNIPFFDNLLVKFFSNAVVITKFPFIGRFINRILGKTYLLKGVKI